MKPSSAKAKGRVLQQAVVAALREHFPSLTSDDIRSTPMGVQGPDVQLSARAKELVPYAFECKNVEKLNVWTAFAQAQAHVGTSGATPVVVCKKNRTHALAVVPWDHFVTLLGPREACEDDPRALLERALALLN